MNLLLSLLTKKVFEVGDSLANSQARMLIGSRSVGVLLKDDELIRDTEYGGQQRLLQLLIAVTVIVTRLRRLPN